MVKKCACQVRPALHPKAAMHQSNQRSMHQCLFLQRLLACVVQEISLARRTPAGTTSKLRALTATGAMATAVVCFNAPFSLIGTPVTLSDQDGNIVVLRFAAAAFAPKSHTAAREKRSSRDHIRS